MKQPLDVGRKYGSLPLARKEVACGSLPVWKVKHQDVGHGFGPKSLAQTVVCDPRPSTVMIDPSTLHMAELASETQMVPASITEIVKGADRDSNLPLSLNDGLMLTSSQKLLTFSCKTSYAFSLTVPPTKTLQLLEVGHHLIATSEDGMDFVDSASRAVQGSNMQVAGSQKVPINNLDVVPWEDLSLSPHTLDIDSDELILLRFCPSITELA